MNLIIFDIDGTLTQTNAVDSKCFARVIEEILQIKDINTDWPSYQYSTDSGILIEIFKSFLQRTPSTKEITLIKNRYVDYLKQAWINDKSLYAPIPGADVIFQQIMNMTDWNIAIATGGWKPSALFKLESAAIPHAELPKAFAEDHIERTEIIKTVIKHAETIHRINRYERIVYVGDRTWDEHAATQLNIEFIGIGADFRNRQQAHGLFIEEYESSSALLHYLADEPHLKK